MGDNRLLKLFILTSVHRMTDHYLPKFAKCLETIDRQNLWKKETPNSNSIGGIVLHICEHVRRNTVRFSSVHPPVTGGGIEQYFPEGNLTPAELKDQVTKVFTEWADVMNAFLANHGESDIEFDLHSLYHLVEHTGYHLGQVVDRVQRIHDVSFQFCQNGINEKQLKAVIEQSMKEWERRQKEEGVAK